MPVPRWFLAGSFLSLLGCGVQGGPVPRDMYLTLSVSTTDVSVQTSINGKHNDFASSDSGAMTASIPLNQFVREGDNEVAFVLALTDSDGEPAPRFLATLEIALTGEIIDTLDPGERTIFSRALGENETGALLAGETITIQQEFEIDRMALEAMKKNAP